MYKCFELNKVKLEIHLKSLDVRGFKYKIKRSRQRSAIVTLLLAIRLTSQYILLKGIYQRIIPIFLMQSQFDP